MRICLIGKFPPIQGGVSMRTYWTAHALAARGHEVHVVTNAKEVRPPFRMHMRQEDWQRCVATYRTGSVTVHWTDPVDGSQSYIPMASPFVSKLAAVTARAHSRHPFDVVFSHYMEPYGVAGHLAAEIAGVPHVVRMAGSDAGRLWRHPQFEELYDHVLRAAAVVVAAGVVAERAVRRGVDPDRIASGGGFVVPEDLFRPDGPRLDIASLRQEVDGDPGDLWWGDFAADRPYFGICGKLGDSKGSFALLAALQRLKQVGLTAGLVALAHGRPEVERRFRATARKLGVADRVLQIPFLPHWRVPEFIRSALAVCCLEQDFPIGFHAPIIPREVLLCGTCLVASTEMIRKFPAADRLPHGYGCVAIEDVNDVGMLAERLAAIVKDPQPASAIGARGRDFARGLQRDIPFPQTLEGILEAAVTGRNIASRHAADESCLGEARFRLTQLAAAAVSRTGRDPCADTIAANPVTDVAGARQVLAAIERGVADGEAGLERLVSAVRTEIAVAAAEDEAGETNAGPVSDPLFRLRIPRWGLGQGDLADLLAVREPGLRVVGFDHDVSELMTVRTAADFPARPAPGKSYIVAFANCGGASRSPLLVDALTAQILELSDGTQTVGEIVGRLTQHGGATSRAERLAWIERLFVDGLIRLQDKAAIG